MKRVCILALALLVAVAFLGCARTGTPNPTVSPQITLTPSASPITTPPQTTPTDVGAGTTDNAGGADTTSMTIPNFKEGTEVNVSDLPDIKSALQEKYEGATIGKITHSLQDTKQLYRIDYTDQNGKTAFLYMTPDGQIVTVNGTGTGTTGDTTP